MHGAVRYAINAVTITKLELLRTNPAEAERGGYEDFDDPDAQIMNSDTK